VPQLSVDPGDPSDEAVGLDPAKNRPCLNNHQVVSIMEEDFVTSKTYGVCQKRKVNKKNQSEQFG
jgi:hypothetical protein